MLLLSWSVSGKFLQDFGNQQRTSLGINGQGSYVGRPFDSTYFTYSTDRLVGSSHGVLPTKRVNKTTPQDHISTISALYEPTITYTIQPLSASGISISVGTSDLRRSIWWRPADRGRVSVFPLILEKNGQTKIGNLKVPVIIQ